MTDPDIVQKIAEAFGITAENIFEPPHAILPTVFLIDEAYVLRKRPVRHLQRFQDSTALLQSVQEKLPFTAMPPLPARDGHLWFVEGDHFWYCLPYIPGRALGTWQEIHSSSDDDTERVLEALRMLHEKTKGMRVHDREEPHRFTEDMQKKLSARRHLLSPHAGRRLNLALERVEGHEEKLGPGDRCFIHGDFHHGNIIVDERGAIGGLIDFDFCRIGHPFEDFGFTMSMLLRSFDADAFRFDPLFYQKCLQWYGISIEEQSLFAEYLLLASLIDLYSFADAEEYGAMQKRKWYLRYQISLVQDLCSRFGGTNERDALPAQERDAKFPVELPEGVLLLAREIGIHPQDVSERFVRGSGHGGQKINKTSSCVELTHEPSRMTVRVQQFREQHKNRIAAWKLLISKIEEAMKGKESKRAREKFRIRKQKQRRSRRAQEKVLQAKRQRGEIKQTRKRAQ